MASIQSFTFNPFQENTYVVFDETKQCVIVDPGCADDRERNELQRFIQQNKLTPVLLLNTHCHIDHMIGNEFVLRNWNIPFQMNELDLYNLKGAVETGLKYGFVVEPSPAPTHFLVEGDEVKFGNTILNSKLVCITTFSNHFSLNVFPTCGKETICIVC